MIKQSVKQSLKKIFDLAGDGLVARMACVFMLVNLIFAHTGGDNADSRFAMMMGMVANNTFAIDGYQQMTGDWSQTPDGKYYSNKPPGPAIFAYPIAWAIDRLAVNPAESPSQLIKTREQLASKTLQVSSWFLQVIPTVLVGFFMDRFMRRRKFSWNARSYAIVAYFFGTTASMLQNSFFGHGMAAWSLFACALFALESRIAMSGAFFGVALLADYGSAMALPGLFYIWYRTEGGVFEKLKFLALGAAIPGVIWIWYHTACFGSPFTTSHKFLNPVWVDIPDEQNALWGIFRSVPKFDIAMKLLFGHERGILFTQPWVLLALLVAAFSYGKITEKFDFTHGFLPLLFTSSIALWLANAAFNGWHGGGTVGPRYLSVAFFCMPLLGAMVWDVASDRIRRLLLVTLGVGVVYFGFIFTQSILGDMNPWLQQYDRFMTRSAGMKFKVALGFLIVCGSSYWCIFKSENAAST